MRVYLAAVTRSVGFEEHKFWLSLSYAFQFPPSNERTIRIFSTSTGGNDAFSMLASYKQFFLPYLFEKGNKRNLIIVVIF